MRIIGGIARGRKLSGPGGSANRISSRGSEIRPTADRAREALFSILAASVVDCHVIDLFAGTGALGLEAVSRGALSALFVDNSKRSLDLVRKNIIACGFERNCTVVKRDLRKGMGFLGEIVPAAGFGVVFTDPPYGLYGREILAALGGSGIVAPDGLVVCEDSSGREYEKSVGDLEMTDYRRYGDTGFWIYRHKTVAAETGQGS